MNRSFLATLLAFSCLGGCATYDPMRGHEGAWGLIQDTSSRVSGSRVELYYIERIDGQMIDNTATATASSNYGRGLSVDAVTKVHRVPARKMKLTLVAETYNAAPVLALLRKDFVARAEIEFEPQPDTFYEVRGELKEGRCSVWLVDQDSGAAVTEKLGSCD